MVTAAMKLKDAYSRRTVFYRDIVRKTFAHRHEFIEVERRNVARIFHPTIPVFLGLDCRASQAGFQGAVVLTPIMRPAVRRPPCLGGELNISRSGVHAVSYR